MAWAFPAFTSAVMILLTACAQPPHLVVDERPARQVLDYEALMAAPARPLSKARTRVVETATSFLGAPHKAKGTTPEGFDCTGYVFYVFQQAAGLTLPRRSHDQVQIGQSLSPTDLEAADLVYFSVPRQTAFHVGLYLGAGRFIHAPGVNGQVEIANLGQDRWRTRFLGARRVLPS
jgi:cell wall-associated NlpC family hydrolase